MARDIEAAVPLHVRRVVTQETPDGVSSVASDGSPRVASAYEHIPGMMTRLIWATVANAQISARPEDLTTPTLSHAPAVGETRFIVATFPPDSVFAAAAFRPEFAAEENRRLSPGLAELFEPDGFHRTDTVDYAVVLDGELCLELGDGSKTPLRRHDCVVQNGARHAWRNESHQPATVAFVLIGATRTTGPATA